MKPEKELFDVYSLNIVNDLTIFLCELAFKHFDIEPISELTLEEKQFDWDSFFPSKNTIFQFPSYYNLSLFIKLRWNEYLKICADNNITPCLFYEQEEWISHWKSFISYHQSAITKHKISQSWLNSVFLTIAVECESFHNNILHNREMSERTLTATVSSEIEDVRREQTIKFQEIQQEFNNDIEKANQNFSEKIAKAAENFQQKTNVQLKKSEKKINEKINKTTEESSKKAIENAIMILGIFASIILTFYGALSFLSAVLGSLEQTTNAYRLILVTLIIGFIAVTLLFGLFFYLYVLQNQRLNNAKDLKCKFLKNIKVLPDQSDTPHPITSKKEKYTIFKIYRFAAIAIIIGIFLTLIGWDLGVIEKRNKRISDKYGEETTSCETTSSIEETSSRVEPTPIDEQLE